MKDTVNRFGGAHPKGAPAFSTALGICLLLGLLLALLSLAAPSAQAQTSYGHVGELGGVGSGPGEFAQTPTAGRVAVHEASGRVFVADTGNDRVQILEPIADESDPDFPLAFVGGVTGSFTGPVGVAIDQVTADLYVMAAGSEEIVKLNPDDSSNPSAYTLDPAFESPPQGSDPGNIGSFGGQAFAADGLPQHGGISVDNSGGTSQGEILVADFGNGLVQRYEAAGWDSGDGFLDSFDGDDGDSEAFNRPFDLAVDSAGEIVVVDAVDFSNVRVERFDPTGAHLASLTSWSVDSNAATATGAIVAANPATGEVIVGRNDLDGATNETAASILQFVDDELHTEINLPADRDSGPVLGIGIRSELPGRLYPFVTEGTAISPGDPIPWLQVYDQADPPECGPVTVSDLGAHQATFEGEVNPMADSGSWRFEYREQGTEDWQRVPVPNAALQGGTEAEDVGPETATGLEPNADHEVRVMAFNPAPCIEAPVETFTTEPVAPVAETGDAHSVSAFGATLGARIDPQNSETTYVFEWGTDQSYGNVTQAKSAGDGRDPTAVFAEVDGLDPSTTYHFRVIATNAEFPERGLSDTGEDSSFSTRPGADSRLPERGYELVSRLDTRGVFPYPNRAANSGNAYVYNTLIPSPGAENAFMTFHRMTRNADGSWSPDPHMPTPPVDPEKGDLGQTSSPLSSADLSLSLFDTTGSYHPMDQNHEGGNTGRDTYLRSSESGDLTWLSRDPRLDDDEPETDPTNAGGYEYLSPDGSIAIFSSSRPLLDSHEEGSGGALYKWDSGELSVVSLDLNGDNIGGEVGGGTLTRNAVSSEGDRVVFTSSNLLYVRIDDEHTAEVGGGDDSDLGQRARYFGADSHTTEIAYVRNGVLYLFDVGAAESTEVGPRDDGASVDGIFAVSDDADRIYFSSPNELTPEADGAERYLYLAERSGDSVHEIGFVSALHPDDRGISPPRVASQNNVDADPSGSTLAFTSLLELVPGRKTAFNPETGVNFPQVYVYEADVDRLYCASCPPDGSAPSGRGDIGAKEASTLSGPTGSWRLNVRGASPRMQAWTNVSESGSVFFQSDSRLVPGDSNQAFDTYEWRGGELQLISSGRGRAHQYFSDASADGMTVFFQSQDDWVPHGGVSGETRFYAARVGGGFQAPDPETECAGEECRGEAVSEPAPSIGSSELRRELREPERVDRALRGRCDRIVRRARASRARAIALVRIARRSRGARRFVAVRRARANVHRTRVLRVHVKRCRRALR